MKIDVLTLFPEMFSGVLGASMLGRAQERGILEFGLHNIREYSQSKHKTRMIIPSAAAQAWS